MITTKPLGVRRGAAALCAALILVSAFAHTARSEQDIPSALQAAIITRLLGYDRALKGRAGGSLTIGILAKASDHAGTKAQSDMQQAFGAQTTVQGMPMSVKAFSYTTEEELTAWVAAQGVDVLYVAPGLDKEIGTIQALCVSRRLVSVSAVRAFVKQGLAIGVVTKGESAGILVNLAAAKAAGMDLDPKLLNLAEVIR